MFALFQWTIVVACTPPFTFYNIIWVLRQDIEGASSLRVSEGGTSLHAKCGRIFNSPK